MKAFRVLDQIPDTIKKYDYVDINTYREMNNLKANR